MDKKNPTAAGKTGGATKVEQASTTLKGAILRRWANIKMVRNVLLIWLDNDIDENSADCRNTLTQLRRAVNSVNMFTDVDQCIEFISSMNDDMACMIISGSLSQHSIPNVHNMSQVDSIFIFCDNKKYHEQWTQNWSKVKGVFTEIGPICDALRQTTQQCEQNSIGISFIATSGDMSTKNLNQLDCSFIYTQIMKKILLSITFEPSHIQEFIVNCRDAFADNNEELNNVENLEQKYHEKTPIWWYTGEGFLYLMLNRVFRLMSVDIIIKMGFFIGDLHRHIEQLHANQFNGHHSSATFTTYRGQGMSKSDFEQMIKTENGLMSFNNFLSTSKDRKVSLRSARNALTNSDLMGILFVMVIDPSTTSTPFASITDVSCSQTEDEVLFSMHTIFRICEIKPMDANNRLFQVDLILTSDKDKDLGALTDRVREETEGSVGWDQLGRLLLKMNQFDKAEQLYTILLEQTTNDSRKAPIYFQLGFVKDSGGVYKEAIALYKKSLEIYKQILPLHDLRFAICYNNIGMVYYKMGKYAKALLYYEKDLEISRKIFPLNDPDLAKSYNNIGAVYRKLGKYSKALFYYEKDLKISQKSFPPYHPDLGASYNNIGTTYDSMGDYTKARLLYEKAVNIGQHSLPSNHSQLQIYRKNLDRIKKKC